jgi:acetolactate synthase-1/2/3 large subunit
LENGVRLAGARAEMRRLIERLGIPVLTTWPAHDMVPDDHPLMAGRPGPMAPRGANFTLQNSDWLLSIGARLDLVVTATRLRISRARRGKSWSTSTPSELRKMKGAVELPVHADARGSSTR